MQFTISFLVVFFLVFCFGLFFVLQWVVGDLRVVMENQSQACSLSRVVHGVTCECHKSQTGSFLWQFLFCVASAPTAISEIEFSLFG